MPNRLYELYGPPIFNSFISVRGNVVSSANCKLFKGGRIFTREETWTRTA
jgi:hypothetical protein